MRPERDFRSQQLYGVTQRGNQGQWVYRDDQDFRKALELMARYATRYAECLFALFESEISEGALEVVGAVDFVWTAGS